MDRIWTAGLAVIGDEILSGRTQDKNIAQLATWLNAQGIRLAEVRVVPDVQRGLHVPDPERRTELMIIYAEATTSAAPPTAKESAELLERAQAGLRLVR